MEDEEDQIIYLCLTKTALYSGRRILQEQLRSYLITQQYGWSFWWQYVMLFADSQCHHQKMIDLCIVRTLTTLGADENKFE
jgi:hypothetical protein